MEKSLILGNIEGRRRGYQRMRWLDGITNAMDMSLGKIQEMVRGKEAGVLQSMGSQRIGHDWETELNSELQYFGHLVRRVDSLVKTLMLGGTGGRRRRDYRG